MRINNITIGLPCYNEEKNIGKSLEECKSFLKKNKINNYEILVVDNNSTDKTINEIQKYLKNKKIKLVKNKKNIFYSGSVGKIIRMSKYKQIGIIDSDRQYSFKDFAKLFLMLKGEKDIIFGFRGKRKDSILRRFISKIFNYLSFVILESKLKDLNCGIKVLKKPNNFKKLLFKINHANPELYCLFKSKNKKIGEINVSHKDRNDGKSIHGMSNLSKTFVEVLYYFIKLRTYYLKKN